MIVFLSHGPPYWFEGGEEMVIGELTETYPPMQDGVGRVCWAYCQEIEKQGHTAYYVAPEDPAHSRFPGLRTLLYKGLQIPRQNYRLGVPNWSFSFQKELRQIPFDILHIHSPFLSYRVARELQKENPALPIVATFHSKYYDDAMKITHSRAISSGVGPASSSLWRSASSARAKGSRLSTIISARRMDIAFFIFFSPFPSSSHKQIRMLQMGGVFYSLPVL